MSNLHLVTGYAGKEHITSADQGSFNAALMGNGQFVLERDKKFEASIISNNQVRVNGGDILMQGRHIRMEANTYADLYFDNGTNNYKRVDIIAVRYTKNTETDVEEAELVVIKGVQSNTTPELPAHTDGDIVNGNALLNEMPLYKVTFDGINMTGITKLFETVPTWETLKKESVDYIEMKCEETLSAFNTSISQIKENELLDSREEIEANTSSGKFAGALAMKEVFQSVSSGKRQIASAITDKGVATDADADFGTMAQNIGNLSKVTIDGEPVKENMEFESLYHFNLIAKSPCVLTESNTAVIGTVLYVMNSISSKSPDGTIYYTRNELFSYDLSKNGDAQFKCVCISSALKDITRFCLASYNGNLYCIGGCYREGVSYGGNYNTRISKIYKFDGTDFINCTSMPTALQGLNCIVYEGKLHILGGNYMIANTGEFASCVHYEFDGVVCKKIDLLPNNLIDFKVFVYNDKIHITTKSVNSTTSRTFCWYDSGWEEIIQSSNDIAYILERCIVNIEGSVFSIGGRSDKQYEGSFEIFKWETNKWIKSDKIIPFGIIGGFSISVNDKNYLLGISFGSYAEDYYDDSSNKNQTLTKKIVFCIEKVLIEKQV